MRPIADSASKLGCLLMFEEFISNVLGDIAALRPAIYYLLTFLAAMGALMVRELTGRISFAIISLPILWIASLGGHLFLMHSKMAFGVDPVTDAIMGSLFGMSVAVVIVIFIRQAFSLVADR
ncbi:MAG: hypothetical protein AAFY27_09045 [Pseudomonadota bacterium]